MVEFKLSVKPVIDSDTDNRQLLFMADDGFLVRKVNELLVSKDKMIPPHGDYHINTLTSLKSNTRA